MVRTIAFPGSRRNHPLAERGASSRAAISENNAVKTTLNDVCFLLRMYLGMFPLKFIRGQRYKIITIFAHGKTTI